MKIGKFKNSKWLTKAAVEDMTFDQRQTKVEKIVEEQVGDNGDIKPVIYFEGIEKGWPANMTALESLSEITGSDDTDDFVDTAVEIFVDPSVRYAGKRVGGIKLRKQEELNDAIPFE